MAIERQEQVGQDRPAVGFPLSRCDGAIGVRVEHGDDTRCDADARRQIHVDRELVARERHARRLEVFVEPMRQRITARREQDGERGRERFHRRAALAA